jgi:transposase
MAINNAVFHTHASENSKYHALYAYFTLRKTQAEIAHFLGKSKSTIGYWINRYQVHGTVVRFARDRTFISISYEQRMWIIR